MHDHQVLHRSPYGRPVHCQSACRQMFRSVPTGTCRCRAEAAGSRCRPGPSTARGGGKRINDMTTLDDDRLQNPHPGEILLEDFLKPMRINQSELARAIGVPPRRINEVVLGKRVAAGPPGRCQLRARAGPRRRRSRVGHPVDAGNVSTDWASPSSTPPSAPAAAASGEAMYASAPGTIVDVEQEEQLVGRVDRAPYVLDRQPGRSARDRLCVEDALPPVGVLHSIGHQQHHRPSPVAPAADDDPGRAGRRSLGEGVKTCRRGSSAAPSPSRCSIVAMMPPKA